MAYFSEDPAWRLCRGYTGVPLGDMQSCWVGKRPGLARSAVGPLDGDLHGGEEAGWFTG